MNVAAHQKKNQKTGERSRREKTVDRFQRGCVLPICSRSRGQHGEKKVCVRGVVEVTGALGKANSHSDPTRMGSGTAPPR